MNIAIQQTSRKETQHAQNNSNDKQYQHSTKEKLQKMAVRFSIAGDIANLGDEAEELWQELTKLHDCDPASYHVFIKEQMESIKEEQKIKNQKQDKDRNSIIPEKGFVVETFTRASKPSKVFINFCHHEAIRRPMDEHNQKLIPKNTSVKTIEIPLIVSDLRTMTSRSNTSNSKCYAIDVVFHPWCLSKCSSSEPGSGSFRTDLVNLGLLAIEEDRKMCLSKHQWKVIRSKYKNGTGPDGKDVYPLPCPSKGSDGMDCGLDKVMKNPSTLLHSLNQKEDNDVDSGFALKTGVDRISSRKEEEKKKNGGFLIEEIRSTRNDDSKFDQWREDEDVKVDDVTATPMREGKDHDTITKMKKSPPNFIQEVSSSKKNIKLQSSQHKASARNANRPKQPLAKQMKGFLNKKHGKWKPIYNDQSKGDGSSGTGGSYSRLISRCKVVDLSDHEVKNKQESPPRTISLKKELLAEKDDRRNLKAANGVDKFVIEENNCGDNGNNSTSENISFDATSLDQMLSELMEASESCSLHQHHNSTNVDALETPIKFEQKKELKFDQKDQACINISHITQEKEDGTLVLEIDLSGTKVSSIRDVVIEAVGNLVTVTTKDRGRLLYSHSFASCEISAKFKKKKKMLFAYIRPVSSKENQNVV